MGGDTRSGKRRDRKTTIPGRRSKGRVETGGQAATEEALRIKKSAGRLRRLNVQTVADLLGEDAANGKVGALKLMLRLVGRMT